MRSMLVIGLGRFGTHLATKLTELGNEVLVVDRDEDAVSKIESHVTRAQIGDCMNEDVLHALGVGNFDVCFVCISQNFQSSLEITSLLKELGAPYVVAKADREIHAKFLKKIGADEVIYPERDMAQRTAMRYSSRNAFDYFEVSPEYALMEMLPPESWVNKTLRDLDLRTRHRINVIGVKIEGKVNPLVSADHVFAADEHVLIAGVKSDILRLMDKK
jgi:trk system potassium uptake protein TrkA